MPTWTFLSNHALALLCVVRTPGLRLRDIAGEVGITERAAHRIMSDLVEGGYLTRHRVGRRNFYEVHPDVPLRHEIVADRTLGELLTGLIGRRPPRRDLPAQPGTGAAETAPGTAETAL